jgi:hypothetical protein
MGITPPVVEERGTAAPVEGEAAMMKRGRRGKKEKHGY